jgi:hypothetical protein
VLHLFGGADLLGVAQTGDMSFLQVSAESSKAAPSNGPTCRESITQCNKGEIVILRRQEHLYIPAR